jgi:hypothetical protein
MHETETLSDDENCIYYSKLYAQVKLKNTGGCCQITLFQDRIAQWRALS